MTFLHTHSILHRAGLRLVLLALVLTLGIVAMQAGAVFADRPHAAPAATDDASVAIILPLVARGYADPQTRLSRFGIGVDQTVGLDGFGINNLRAGWYWDWGASSTAAQPGGVEYLQTVRFTQTGVYDYASSPDPATIAQIAADVPGSIWLIGNEPDRMISQDDLNPEVYARAYHDTYLAIKTADPTAVVVAGQIVQPTMLRLRYLDAVLAEYERVYGSAMPVDAWAIHAYILNENDFAATPGEINWGADVPPGISWEPDERLTISWWNNVLTTDPTLFQGFITTFRQWMADNGYQSVPLLITEFGVLPPEDMIYSQVEGEPGNTQLAPEEARQRVLDFMQAAFDYLSTATDPDIGCSYDNNRLVQAWAWFSLAHDQQVLGGSLHDWQTGERTAYGQLYADYAAAIPATVNLLPVALSAQPSGDPGNDIGIVVTLVNNGGIEARACTIRCFAGDPQQDAGQIGQDVVLDVLRGAAIPRAVVLTWQDAPAGEYRLYVVVDPDNTITETNETDNVLSADVIVP